MDCRIMKFKIGNKVEVLRRRKQHSDFWFPGRITSVDGDQYIVKYEKFLTPEGEPVVEKVNHGDVRPPPPTAKEEEKWVAGDIAEVFDIYCWRVGKVAKVLKSDRFVVRLFGSIQLKQFHQATLRVHQAWQNHKWVLIGKVVQGGKKLGIHDGSEYSVGSASVTPQQGLPEEIRSREEKGQDCFKTFHYSRTLKRNHRCHFDDEVMELRSKKRKLTLEAGGRAGSPMRNLPFSKQVDAIYSAEANGGKNSTFGFLEKRAGVANSYVVHPFSVHTDQVSEDSNGCSVASCSSNDLAEYTAQTARRSFKNITDTFCNDAESLCPSASWREYLPSGNAFKANIRELELHAYRRTLQALYASGPLSWEQESLLTNLRLSLHISNEEHLLQLRQLLSAQDF